MDRRVRFALLVVICVSAAWLLWRVRRLFTPFVLAVVLSYLLLPGVRLLERRGVPRPAAILLIYVATGTLGALSIALVVPYLSREIALLIDALPEQTARLEGLTLDWLRELGARDGWPQSLRGAIEGVVGQVERLLAATVSRVVGLVMGLFTSFLYVLLAPVLAFFIMRDLPHMGEALLGLFPPRYHEDLILLGRRVDRVVSGYIRGQLLVSLVIGLLIAGGLAALRVPYALVVGLVGGAFNVVPYFGPVIGAVPAVLLALTQSPAAAVWTVALFVGVNQLESAVLAPKIVGDLVGLHPLTVILAVLVGAELAGITGMLLSVPATAVLKVSGEILFVWLAKERAL